MNTEHYKQLIIQQLSGGISEEQEAELGHWLKAHPDHQEEQVRLAKAWKHSDLYKANIEVDQAGAWNTIAAQLPKERKIIPIWKRKWAVAASILIVISLGWFVLQQSTPELMQYATAEGETQIINLPDGSIVSLNENSQLSYQEAKQQRLVELSGEAFFEVSHDPENPFSVLNKTSKTTVLGTKFNIDGSSESQTKVSLIEGKISFEVGQEEQIILAPGEELSYDHNLKALVQDQAIDNNLLSWKTKTLKFENEKITKVIQTLEDYFDKEIELTLDTEDCRFTGSFNDPKYEEIIEVLKFTFELDFIKGTAKDQIHIHNCK